MADLKGLIVKRGAIKGQLTRFKTFVASQTGAVDFVQLEGRLNKISDLDHDFNDVQTSIEILDVSNEEHANDREIFENDFYEAIAAARRILAQREGEGKSSVDSEGHSNTSRVNLTQIRLPTLNLPTFDGLYSQWLFFRDTFESIIHNNDTITEIQKFHYLRLSLKGDAAEVINALEISAENYKTAWELLTERFENKSLLINNHTKALLHLPAITKESFLNLRSLWGNVSKHLRALEVLGLPVKKWDALLVAIITEKLDPITRREWEAQCGKDIPKYDELAELIKEKCILLEKLQIATKPVDNTSNQRTRVHALTEVSCLKCAENHSLGSCKEFIALPLDAKWEEAKRLKVCSNCLRQYHIAKNCNSSTCRKCNKHHHTLLHKNYYTQKGYGEKRQETKPHSNSSTPTPTHEVKRTTANTSANTKCSQVLLSTALIQIKDSRGNTLQCKALLDSGSQSNFITESLCKRLQLPRRSIEFTVCGINQGMSTITQSCQTEIHSRTSHFSSNLTLLILPRITDDLPHITFNKNLLDIPRNITLADPSFDKTSSVDVLLGAEIFWNLLSQGQMKLDKSGAVLQRTQLGWIIAGPLDATRISQPHQSLCNFVTTKDLDESLKKFWELEDIREDKKFSPEERRCEEHFMNNTTREPDGRFVVRIPFKGPTSLLGESRQNAEKRFYNLEKKFARNQRLHKQYSDFMEEYETMSHMTLVSDPDLGETHYYLPHHGVINENSVTTKFRVVFDASAPTSTGVSLNDLQMTGPVIQDDLLAIILRFRKHNYVISADVTKMYRQVMIDPKERCLQRILWRTEPTKELMTYQLNTVTYGTTAGSYLAIRCLKMLADEAEGEYPEAARIIKRDFYVDDLLSGADSIEEAATLCKEIAGILKRGCFYLCKWRSNNAQTLNLVCNLSKMTTPLTFGMNAKVLGLTWSSHEDILKYNISARITSNRITKRSILAETAQIFDPLGLISPCTIMAKIILQRLWQCKIEWDESIPLELHTRWTIFRAQLHQLNEISIHRQATCQNRKYTELHGFSDASELAYGAAIYIRCIDTDGNYSVQLLCAKSRVAPLKSATIPRLELCAALMLSRLMTKVTEALDINFDKMFHWTDSSIVLSWIRTNSSQWKMFVSNRIAEIQDLTDPYSWHHVRTFENSADLLTRGIDPQQIKENNLWWHGPEWLRGPADQWHINNEGYQFNYEDLAATKNIQIEQRKKTSVLCTTLDDLRLFERYSTLKKLQRVSAYCLRFMYNVQAKVGHRQYGPLTHQELDRALKALMKGVQMHYFAQEIEDLSKGRQVRSSSKLIALAPFLDHMGLIRVGGRLRNSNLDHAAIHPIILPPDSSFTRLMIEQEHISLLHAGSQAVLASLRQRVWIVRARNLVKRTLQKCIKCFRFRAAQAQYQMGDLPHVRVTPARPFLHCGVDYAGPFLIRDRSTRNYKTTKAYVCLFGCMATKATHIELVSSLSTEAFLAAMRRFASRRGKCSNIYSDNGTNFVGANAELIKFIKDDTNIATILNQEGITWHFNPARSPHFGGLWEAGIKSVKYHLLRVVGESKLSFEEFTTLLTQIEACLNSRPLTPLSSDPSDTTPLTPAHFLIGESMFAVPDADLQDIKQGRLSRFQHVQQMSQHFWTRWHKEYITELQTRVKWRTQHPVLLHQGALVLVKEDNTPPLRWPLARVMELHPGRDGVCRVVTVKMCSAVLKRPVIKLCVLPISDE